MRQLYHMSLCPISRFIRLVLAEKDLDFLLTEEKIWLRREQFLALNPAGTLPVLVEENGTVVAPGAVIVEYLAETYPDGSVALLPGDVKDRVETRRLVDWFTRKFQDEVSHHILFEKVDRALIGAGAPNVEAIRAGMHNLRFHLEYMDYLLERRNWLAGHSMSLADLAAAAQISCVDYLGDVPWEVSVMVKEWYARIKSRPSFRPLLADRQRGVPATPGYADLDF